MTRVRALRVSALSVSVLLFANTAAAQEDLVEIPIAGCNSQGLADGDEVIFWTSSFATDMYVFDEEARSGEIVSGTGDTLEVTVQWSTSDPGATSSPEAFGPRGAGFSPGGVDGTAVGFYLEPILPLENPVECFVEVDAMSYGSATFTLTFTSLHKPLRRGSGAAKGNAQFEIDVDVRGEVVSLGTNVHVATAPDPDQ